jgi:4-hydroxymandelate oxidase
VSLDETEARRRLPLAVYDFFAGGAEDERTLAENERAFERWHLLPRVLRGRGVPRLEQSLLGCRSAFPIVLSPTAFHRLAHPEGESATVRAAAAAGVIPIVSMAATQPIEQIAGAVGGAPWWFQLYLQPDLAFTERLLRRVEAAGCRALVLTVDSPAFGARERDLRNGFIDLPPPLACENLREAPDGPPRPIAFSPDFSWEHFDWLRQATRLPIAVKGILHPADAELAIAHGADAVFVSNHGGRQLDGAPPTALVLPAIARAVRGRVPILIDGGIRRGADAVKALALGASAAAIGRPAIWGLAAGGEAGVRAVLERFRAEIARCLTLCGVGSLPEVDSSLLLEGGRS